MIENGSFRQNARRGSYRCAMVNSATKNGLSQMFTDFEPNIFNVYTAKSEC